MVRIIILILMHAGADFLLQGSALSKLKLKNYLYLLAHVGIYTAFFIVLSPVALGLTFKQGLVFALINGGFHLVVDFVTINIKNRFWGKNEAAYIITISFDHIVHIAILICSFIYLYPDIFAKALKLE